jgi:3-dehydrosphinganine reductase
MLHNEVGERPQRGSITSCRQGEGLALDFGQKVVLVTGGSSGIGLAVAGQLAARGARIAVLARDPGRLEEAAAHVAALDPAGRTVLTVSADVADPAQAHTAVQRVISEFGTPDLVVNAAGVVFPGYFEHQDLDEFHRTMDVDYYGTLHVTKEVVPAMLARGSGHIVNVSSQLGFLGMFGYSSYCASKFAVRGFTDALRSEFKGRGLDFTLVFPPDTDTPGLAEEKKHQPAEYRILSDGFATLSPEAVAKDIIKAVERRRYIVVPGFDGKMLMLLCGVLGSGAYPIVDYLVAGARRKAEALAGAKA